VDAEDNTTLRILPLPFLDVPYRTVACEEIITQLITSGPYSIIGTKEGSVLLYNSETDTLVRTKNHHACITALHVLPDGRIASGDEKGHLKIITLNHT
jgi:tricorn protease-like protein